MLSEITIYRDLPVVAGYVQVPTSGEYARNALTVPEAQAKLDHAGITDSELIGLSLGSGNATGYRTGRQQFLRVAAEAVICCMEWRPDPIAVLAVPRPDQPSFALM